MSVVVLISGRGSNMQALLEAGIPVAAVIANREDAAGLVIAAARGVPIEVVPHKSYATREAFDRALADVVARFEPKVVALAGFMRVLTAEFLGRFERRVINIHPSLLPSFPGLRTHERALEAGVRVHGCTVHFVTPELDHGPMLIQAAVPVLAGDTAETLAARVLRQEHRVFPRAIRWLLEGRAVIDGGAVRVTAGTSAGEAAQWIFDERS